MISDQQHRENYSDAYDRKNDGDLVFSYSLYFFSENGLPDDMIFCRLNFYEENDIIILLINNEKGYRYGHR